MLGSERAKIVPKQFVDDFELVAKHYKLREIGQYDEAKQAARDDLESAIICFADISKRIMK